MAQSRAGSGLREAIIRLRQKGHGDIALYVSLTVYAMAMLPYVMVLPEQFLLAFENYYAEILLLTVTGLLFLRAAVVASAPNVRRFWSLICVGFGVWLAISAAGLALEGVSSVQIALFEDVLFLVFFGVTTTAIELRLDKTERGPGIQQHTAAAIGSVLLIFAVFGYFAILPLISSDRSYVTPYSVHAGLDAYFAARFLFASIQTKIVSWRRIFAGFSAVFFLISLADALSLAYRTGLLEYHPGDGRNFIWFLWFPVAMLLTNIRLEGDTSSIQSSSDMKLNVATRGLLIFGLALPFIHVLGYGFRIFSIESRQLRDLFVAIWIMIISALLVSLYFYFRKKVDELREQRTDAEQKFDRIEDQLNRELRIRSLGRLSAGLAHDFGNTLTAVSMYTGLIRDKTVNDASVTEDVNGLTESIRYAKDLVDKLSMYGNSGVQSRSRIIDFNEEVSRTIGIVRTTLPPDIVLNFEEVATDIHVRAETQTIHQVVTNYIYNAMDALPDGGVIDVSVFKKEIRSKCVSCGDRFAGLYAGLIVDDSGPGVDEALAQQIFEPLVSTKPVGLGSGLGLSTVHLIVHSVGGHVQLSRNEKGGARFAAYFQSTGVVGST